MNHSEEYRPWVERLKSRMDHAEYRLEKLRRKRGHLVVGSKREDLQYWAHPGAGQAHGSRLAVDGTDQ